MNPQFGNGATPISDDFGPRREAPVILIHGHPFKRTTRAPRTAAPAASAPRAITSDLQGCRRSPVVPGKAPRADPPDGSAARTARPDVEQMIVGGVSTNGRITGGVRLRHPGPVRPPARL
ncbi:hypothetical protein GCM10010425_12240 [Streptomyces spororaveus]|uniref:Uncharacterized protein n=1 Tax=Streptomyces spororaveus TaxID=284039 RepID=A0ABQ3T5U2_9ACTN|nr:hypothetical protein Sspor_09360 [Streptomyces spororaveus]